MKVTKELIKELYKKYNRMYFNNELSMCDCHYIKLDKCTYGRYTNKQDDDGTVHGKIWITNDVDWTEEALRNVVVHEMIHHYVKSIKKKNEYLFFKHGFQFRKKMHQLNKDFNLGITVSTCPLNKKSKKD